MPATQHIQQPVILFDGMCNLCSSAVQFVISRDKNQQFLFASLQSNFGQATLQMHNLDPKNFNSFLLHTPAKIYTKSTAALRVAKHLNGGWPLLYGFIIIPPFIRDAVYNFIANNRYRWFGKKETCWLPTPQLRKRFVE